MARLLLVEDDADVRDLITMRMVMVGHRVMAMPDALGALEAVEYLGAPDAYVLDVALPDLDGFDLLGRLRQTTTADVPAIFLTAYGQESNVRRGEELGAAAYLVKPFVAQRLIDAVDEALVGRPRQDHSGHAW